jgi:hypothetical protein
MQDTREGSEKRSLAESGDAFEQHVSAGKKADEDAVNDVLLPHDDLADLLANAI